MAYPFNIVIEPPVPKIGADAVKVADWPLQIKEGDAVTKIFNGVTDKVIGELFAEQPAEFVKTTE